MKINYYVFIIRKKYYEKHHFKLLLKILKKIDKKKTRS